MTFQVRWREEAANTMLAAWNVASPADQHLINRATFEMDSALEKNPDQLGESRAAGMRVHTIPPLTVHYRINVRLGTVLIEHARVFRPRH
jgi:hypothetical protein